MHWSRWHDALQGTRVFVYTVDLWILRSWVLRLADWPGKVVPIQYGGWEQVRDHDFMV